MFAVLLTACVIVIINLNHSAFPTQKQLVKEYQDAGYEVTVLDGCGDIADVTRIIATKDELIADFVYSKRSGVFDDVQNYYEETYENSYIIGHFSNNSNEYIYYANDAEAWKVADIKPVEVSVDAISID